MFDCEMVTHSTITTPQMLLVCIHGSLELVYEHKSNIWVLTATALLR